MRTVLANCQSRYLEAESGKIHLSHLAINCHDLEGGVVPTIPRQVPLGEVAMPKGGRVIFAVVSPPSVAELSHATFFPCGIRGGHGHGGGPRESGARFGVWRVTLTGTAVARGREEGWNHRGGGDE